jgi:bifunctional DNase/RNase
MLPAELLGVRLDPQHQPVVLLRHEDRVLVVAIGPHEAESIHIGLTKHDFGRPLTHDLICNVLAGLGGELQSVHIYKLENNTFYAYLNIEQKSPEGQVEQVIRVDARPSDSIAVACRTESPIFIAEKVLDEAGQDITIIGPEEEEEHTDEEMDD